MYLEGSDTNRLLIRKLEVSDMVIWELFFENNIFLPFLGLDLTLNKKAQSIDWIERQLWRYENNKYGHHALIDKKTKKFIGQYGLLTQEIDDKLEIEIGYHIIPKYWGIGYATEATMKFRDYAFEKDLFISLISIIDIRNVASQKVAEKNGMRKTKQVKYYDLDVYIYRVEKDPNNLFEKSNS